MQRLTLLRHGHAEDRHPSGADFSRRLDARGIEEADASARRLLVLQWIPDRILASPAQRTRETALRVARGLGLAESLPQFDQRIYGASPAQLLRVIHEAGAGTGHLLIVGHNPTISELPALLSAGSAEVALGTAEFSSWELHGKHWRVMPVAPSEH